MQKLKSLILSTLLMFSITSNACDNSTITIISQITNADGTITYNLDLGIDHGGLDATYYGYVLEFNFIFKHSNSNYWWCISNN